MRIKVLVPAVIVATAAAFGAASAKDLSASRKGYDLMSGIHAVAMSQNDMTKTRGASTIYIEIPQISHYVVRNLVSTLDSAIGCSVPYSCALPADASPYGGNTYVTIHN